MRKIIKSFIPPILWDKIQYVRHKRSFSKYKNLLSKNIGLKDIHKGKKCFILGSGPSIKKEDLKPLKNEIIFALNNFYVHEDFAEIMSGNVPKYYMTAPVHLPQSEQEWKKWFEDMEKYISKSTKMLFGLNNYDKNIKYIFEKYGLFNDYEIYWYYALRSFNEDSFEIRGMDITKSIYSGETVSIYALILAIYMGFDEIYLLGMDHDYFLYEDESQMRMYDKAIHQNNEFERTFGDTFYIKEFLRQYNIFMKYKTFADNSNSKIFNASDGGILKIFPRVKFQDIVSR